MTPKETKMAGPEQGAATAELMAAFEAYKQANDARLAEIEAKGGADPLTDERLKRIDRRLEALSLKAAAPALGGEPAEPVDEARSAAWQRYLRAGDESGLARLDTKSLNTGTDEQGGYVAPPELDRLIESRLQAALPAGPTGRWDWASRLTIEMAFAELESANADAVRAGANLLFVETPAGWEAIGFQHAVLVDDRVYQLSGLLRGLYGSDGAAETGASIGARCVLADERLVRGALNPGEAGAELMWRAGLNGEIVTRRCDNVQARPWQVAHLRQRSGGGGSTLSWFARDLLFENGWTGPDPNPGLSFEIEWDHGSGFVAGETVSVSEVTVPGGAENARVRQRNPAGLAGAWVTIGLVHD